MNIQQTIKQILIVYTISWLCLIISCSSKQYVITDYYAYASTDDSSNVALQYNEMLKHEMNPIKIDSIQGDYLPPKPTYTVEGNYPTYGIDNLRNKRYIIEGEVWVRIYINELGIVERAFIIKSSHQIFNKPSLDAVVKWSFTPAYLNEVPVKCVVSVPFRYKYQK